MHTCKSISRSPDPFGTVLRNSWFASARTHPPHCRQEAAVPPRAVRGCPPCLPCRARAPSLATFAKSVDACSSRRISTPNQKNRTPRSRRCAHHAARAAETRPTLRGRHQSPRTRMPCRGGHPVPSASQRPLQKTTIHMLKLGRIARLGAVNKRTGKIPVIRPSRRSVVFTKSHPICLSCSCAPKICRRSARRISRQKRRTRRAQPAALAQHGVGSTHAKRHMFLSRFAHTRPVAG